MNRKKMQTLNLRQVRTNHDSSETRFNGGIPKTKITKIIKEGGKYEKIRKHRKL